MGAFVFRTLILAGKIWSRNLLWSIERNLQPSSWINSPKEKHQRKPQKNEDQYRGRISGSGKFKI